MGNKINESVLYDKTKKLGQNAGGAAGFSMVRMRGKIELLRQCSGAWRAEFYMQNGK